jgi:hypothetical protein
MHASPFPHPLPLPSLPAMLGAADAHLPWCEATHTHDAAAVSLLDSLTTQWIWNSRFGTIVIEVRGNDVFVNGDRVTPHAK